MQAWELTLHMMTGENPPRAGRGHTYLLWQWYSFRTADGWMAIGGVDPSRWTAFCHAIGRPQLETDPRFDSAGKRIRDRGELNALLDDHFSTRPTEHWLRALESADIFCAPVLDYAEVTSHEQVRANGYVRDMTHPKMGQMRIIPCPIDFKSTPADSTRPEPTLGQHTDEVLRSFGYGEGDVQALRHGGVV
jgi:crotonobetainyl-CoA:carnitine CoA-transferase CaiB-like acyl-CoA transferase